MTTDANDHEITPNETGTNLEADQINHFHQLAERLIRDGKTTFADARTALEKYNNVQQ